MRVYQLLLLFIFTNAIITSEQKGCSTKIPPWIQRSLIGKRRSGSEERIVGGFKALEPIPWQAHITIMVGIKSNQCGGTILDEETILTAAHCLKPLGPIYVETGIIENPSLKRNFVINENNSNVKEVFIHPDFENVYNGDDIAILKLKTPLTFDNDTKPACLPEPTFSPEDKELGFVSGWGRYSSRSLVSDTLRYVPIPLVKNTDCVSWAPQYESILKDTMVCAGKPGGGVDSCEGDSGGPLVVGGIEEDYDIDERASSATDSAIIYGIVSFGPKRCGRPKVTGVYTRVTKYLTWISSHMKVKSTPITPTTQFQCRDYSIPIQFKCDGLVQCVPDGSDEIDCPTKSTNKSSKDQNMKYVLVTGWPRNDETAQMEVMDESGSTKICKNPKSKYPLQVEDATGVYTEGRMIVCGGTYPPKSACYSYEDDQQGWTMLADMDTQRWGSSSIQIPGGILVTGGHDGSNILKTSEIIFINGTVKQGKSLPEPRGMHCIVEYQGQIFSIGGKDGNDDITSDVWSFNNHVEFTLTNKPSMKHSRGYHACGIVHSKQHQDRPLLVVAGGGGNGHDKSEYLDFTLSGAQWQLCSKDLPFSMYNGPRMTTTKNKNQLLMTYRKGIYSFNCRSSDDCYWEKEPNKLQVSREWPVIMKVPGYMVENC